MKRCGLWTKKRDASSTVTMNFRDLAGMRFPSPPSHGFSGGNVAQICNLLYRRFAIGTVEEQTDALAIASGKQNTILRYSRLKICATLNRCPSFGGEGQPALRSALGEGGGEEAVCLETALSQHWTPEAQRTIHS